VDEPANPAGKTIDPAYADRLASLESVWWKRLIPVQAPYRWNLRRLRLGRTLDVGCGLGRNLAHLEPGSVGVDHNEASVAVARARGLSAYTVDELSSLAGAGPSSFDTLLFAHVIEHLPTADATELVRQYVRYLRPGGRLVCITPQERGFATDPTHVVFVDLDDLAKLAEDVGFQVERRYSFPLPRRAGRLFPYNEFVLVARLPR